MKKIITFLIITLPMYAASQVPPNPVNIDSIQVSLTIRATDWAWLIGRYGDGSDSTTRAEVRNIRTQLLALNPTNWNTSATVTSVSARLVMSFYSQYAYAGFAEIQAMGTTNGERVTIYNAIRALPDTTIQNYIASVDQGAADHYVGTRKNGKQILLDGGSTPSSLKNTRIIIVPLRPRRN